MRHDEHYVEALAASAGTPIGRLIPIDLLDPNPNQPRRGDGRPVELMASALERQRHQPLIADRAATGFRSSPASYAGCGSGGASRTSVVIATSMTEVIELALVENIQRKDLTAFEEAEALQHLAHAVPIRTRRWLGNLESRGHPSLSRWPSTRCLRRSRTFVGWPTFPLNHYYYR
jgi:ParB family chromosome partitioning protein